MRLVTFGRQRNRGAPPGADTGFTLVELMVVVLIIGILVAIAIPVFNAAKDRAQLRTCFANQRSIMSAASIWRVDTTQPISAIAGILDSANPLMNPLYLIRPPRCPAAGRAADPNNPTLAEGAYSIDTSGNVEPCTFGVPLHGSIFTP